MRKLVYLFIISTFCLSAQPVTHVLAGKAAWDITGSFCDSEWKQAKPFMQPIAAIGSHYLLDKKIGEAYLGDQQIALGVIRCGVIWLTTPPEKQAEQFAITFWTLLPDIMDKWLGMHWTHEGIGSPDINMDRDSTEMLEALSMLTLAFEVKL